ncbi:hypothetical protein CFI00_07995 [Nocardioides sp. S5]|uniref:VOC family protein n=1 Tax=Nocardioides sp. S5 TaxID=2017486 RepID=UPI001A8EDBFC|nr:VOC family protein [Nocardioides sp. S5]QSR30445.1 hypothetical protein CFI00_07995 [Nocardioides sp. S5]
MGARFDHLVVAVDALDEAAARWRAAGLGAERGGAHPVGTVNVLVRGPQAAYVELIAAGSEESNPWLDRVRPARGPISWAVAVDDVDAAREALHVAGFEPGPVRDGSRTTPAGEVVAWRMCDVGPGPYDGSLPFLIQWTSPMGPGPANGPVLEHVALTPPDPERVADLLLALGLEPSRHWPRRVFADAADVRITLQPSGEPAGRSAWSMSWEQDDEPVATLTLRTASGGLSHLTLDGVAVLTWPDRRCLAASVLQPSAGAASAVDRAQSWVEAVVAAGLGTAREVDVVWAGDGFAIDVVRSVRLDGPDGTQPVTVVTGTHPLDGHGVAVVGVGDPVEVLERQPTIGEPSVAEQVSSIDDAFAHALSGGVYAVRDGDRSVVRHFNGRSGSGRFAEGEQERWLDDAAAGRRTDGVVRGEPWV